jgi:RNA polymerase sigma factor (sigma-70 family)
MGLTCLSSELTKKLFRRFFPIEHYGANFHRFPTNQRNRIDPCRSGRIRVSNIRAIRRRVFYPKNPGTGTGARSRTAIQPVFSAPLHPYDSVRRLAGSGRRFDFGDLLPVLFRENLSADHEFVQPDAITQYEELYQDVEKAIGTLPIQRRKIYLLHHFEGKRFKEIAGELQISVRTVEVQIYRSRQAIRQLLKEKWLITLLLGLLLPK